jgi:mRNA interferase MazF
MSSKIVRPTGVRRGQIWWVDFNPVKGSEQGDLRPAVVVSPDAANREDGNHTVVVVPITSKGQAYPDRIPVDSGGVKGFALIGHIRVLDKSRLERQPTQLDPAELQTILTTLQNFFK